MLTILFDFSVKKTNSDSNCFETQILIRSLKKTGIGPDQNIRTRKPAPGSIHAQLTAN